MSACLNESDLPIIIHGQQLELLPKDLYIPPDALRILLDSFDGPLDLLLYLIRKQKMDILDIPVAQITRQYVQYIDMMKVMKMELAAEYLLMAAMLAEIKSKLLLPAVILADQVDEADPRAELVRRLQAYETAKFSAQALATRPQLERDIFIAYVAQPDIPQQQNHAIADCTLEMLQAAYREVLQAQQFHQHHQINLELLTIEERVQHIQTLLKMHQHIAFSQLFQQQKDA